MRYQGIQTVLISVVMAMTGFSCAQDGEAPRPQEPLRYLEAGAAIPCAENHWLTDDPADAASREAFIKSIYGDAAPPDLAFTDNLTAPKGYGFVPVELGSSKYMVLYPLVSIPDGVQYQTATECCCSEETGGCTKGGCTGGYCGCKVGDCPKDSCVMNSCD